MYGVFLKGGKIKVLKLIVFAAVSQDGFALRYASEELKKDKEFMLVAYENNPNSLMYASLSMQELIMQIIKQKGKNKK